MSGPVKYQQSAIAIDYGKKNLLRMNLNENIVFPKNVMRSILAKCVDNYDPRLYPPAIDEGESLIMNQEIARYCFCSRDSVAIGIGGDQLIDLVFRSKLVSRSDSLLLVSPTFSMYSILCQRLGRTPKEIWLGESTARIPFSFPLEKIKKEWSSKTRARLLVIVSPNNPTGTQFPLEQIEEILETAPEKTVLLDEAYVEFAKYDAAKRLMQKHQNLVILRTFSKAFGLASLRLGYLLSSDVEFIQKLNTNFQYPYPVAGLTIAMGVEMLRNKKLVLEYAEKTKALRGGLISSLQSFSPKLHVFPESDTNFVIVRAKNAGIIAQKLLADYSIAIKYYPDLGREKNEFLRITVGPAEANSRLIFALKRVLA